MYVLTFTCDMYFAHGVGVAVLVRAATTENKIACHNTSKCNLPISYVKFVNGTVYSVFMNSLNLCCFC